MGITRGKLAWSSYRPSSLLVFCAQTGDGTCWLNLKKMPMLAKCDRMSWMISALMSLGGWKVPAKTLLFLSKQMKYIVVDRINRAMMCRMFFIGCPLEERLPLHYGPLDSWITCNGLSNRTGVGALEEKMIVCFILVATKDACLGGYYTCSVQHVHGLQPGLRS